MDNGFRAGMVGLAAALAAPHRAEAALQVWQGTAYLSGVTATCTSTRAASVGDFFTLIYRPIIGTTQTGPEGITFLSTRAAAHFFATTGNAATASFRGTGKDAIIDLNSHAQSSVNGTGTFRLAIVPSPIAATTEFVTMTGSLTNFFDVTGCTVTFAAALTRRID